MKAIFFNPTKQNHVATYALLSQFDDFTEQWLTPLGIKYLKDAKVHLDQADILNNKKTGLFGKFFRGMRRLFFAMQYSGVRSSLEKDKSKVVVSWGGRSDVRYVFMEAAKAAGCKTLYLELSPFPNTIAVDPKGINYLNSVPRDKEFYRSWGVENDTSGDNWLFLKSYMAQRRKSTQGDKEEVSLVEPYIFIAAQTDGDSQLRDFGGNYGTVESFIRDVCKASSAPGMKRRVIVKEHPNTRVSLAHVASDYENVSFANQLDTTELIARADLVMTVNSSVGIESLLMGKPVAVAGCAFWDISSLTYSAKNCVEMIRVFELDQYFIDEPLRNSFLNYLDQKYYVKINWQADGTARIPKTEIEKVWAMLDAC